MEHLHGTEVADPYRWLEDAESPRVRGWVTAHGARTRRALDSIPGRDRLHRRLSQLLEAGTVDSPAVAGDRVFSLERWGGRQQAVVVVRSRFDPDDRTARVVVDPAPMVEDAAAAVDWFSPSPDGGLVAYGISVGGTEHGVLRVVETDTGHHLPEAIGPVRHPSLAWLPDGSAFAYSRLPDPVTVPEGERGYWEKLFWHRVGDDPAADEPLGGPDLGRTALPMAVISPGGRWLAIHVHLMPSRTDVYLLDRTTGSVTVAVEGVEASTWCRLTDEALWAVTTVDAPRGRVVTASLARPQVEAWTTVVAESQAVVADAAVAGDSLLVVATEHAVSRLWHHDLAGRNRVEVALPGLGSVTGLDATDDSADAFLTYTSFATPPTLYRWTPGEPLRRWSHHARAAASDEIEVTQAFYPSPDGTRVPMFVVQAVGTPDDRPVPTVLGGYGGFAISSTPAFSPGVVAWCSAGGRYALANIRGGGEYGEEWHRRGMLEAKQNTFDDFMAAADWLVSEGLTSPGQLGIRGGSNGGLLVAAAMTQRPEAFRAVVCAVGLLDMLRYHRFLIGALWIPEYGDPDDPEAFAWLRDYSPYHRLEPGTAYPATLLTAGESDSRVDPMHARKFAARLMATTSSDEMARPVLLRVEPRAGHGAGKPAGKQADEAADTWGFLAHQLGLPLERLRSPA